MSEVLNLVATSPKKSLPDTFKSELRKNTRESNVFAQKQANTFSKVLSSKASSAKQQENIAEADNSGKAIEQLNFFANLNKQSKEINSQVKVEEPSEAVVVKQNTEEIQVNLANPLISLLANPNVEMLQLHNSVATDAKCLVVEPEVMVELPKLQTGKNSVVGSASSSEQSADTEILTTQDTAKLVAEQPVFAVEHTASKVVSQVNQLAGTEPVTATLSNEKANSDTEAQLALAANNLGTVKVAVVGLVDDKQAETIAKTAEVAVKTTAIEQAPLATIQLENLETLKFSKQDEKLKQLLQSKISQENPVSSEKTTLGINVLQGKVDFEQQVKNLSKVEKQTTLAEPVQAVTSEVTTVISAQNTNTNTQQGSTTDLSQTSLAVTLDKTQTTSELSADFKAKLESTQQNSTLEISEDKLRTARQLVENIRLLQKAGNTEMMIRLKPEHLGEMVLKISLVNGSVNANFHTNNAEARGILEAAMPQLRQELSSSGFKVHDVGVYAGLGEFMSKKDGQESLAYSQKQKQPNLQKINNPKLTETELQQLAEQGLTINDGIDYKI